VPIALPATASAKANVGCTKIASPAGSDSGAGTAGHPFATAQRLVGSLAPGQTGCLRTGVYEQRELTIATPGLRLTSFPGERAQIVGRIRVSGAGVLVDDLTLNGRNDRGLPSPTINADNVTFRHNGVSSPDSRSCFALGGTMEVRRSVIQGNRIHNCGASLLDSGIYMSDVDDAKILGNVIYDNAGRGIKVGPDSQGALIRGNVIDGNPIGLNFSGVDTTASSNNLVKRNVIANATGYWNVQTYWPGPVGSGNLVRRNCLHGGNPDPHYNQDGGVSDGPGFTAQLNLIAAPLYVNRRAKDFRLRRTSPCRAVYRSAAGADYGSPLAGAILELRRLVSEAIATLQE
jgi:Right handed beta helix region